MENSILEAANKAEDAELKAWEEHILTPFHKFGIRTFKGLKEEFEKRDAAYTSKIKEEADAVKAKQVAEETETAVKQLNLAGVRDANGKELDAANSIVKTYMAIGDKTIREDYVKNLLPKSKSGERVEESKKEESKKAPAVGSISSKISGIVSRFAK